MLPRVNPDSATSTWKLSSTVPLTMATRSSSGRCALMSILRVKLTPFLVRGDPLLPLGGSGFELLPDEAVEELGVLVGFYGEGETEAVTPATRGAPVLPRVDDARRGLKELTAQRDLDVEDMAHGRLEGGGGENAPAAQGDDREGVAPGQGTDEPPHLVAVMPAAFFHRTRGPLVMADDARTRREGSPPDGFVLTRMRRHATIAPQLAAKMPSSLEQSL